jgi:phosphoglycerate dehydrogenase-like enzyme
MKQYRVGLSRDLRGTDGAPVFPETALSCLGAQSWEWLAAEMAEITPEVAARYDALCVNTPRVTEASVARPDNKLRIIARFGVGYDSVDVGALTRAGVILTNTPEAVRRPVATMAITYVLALAQKMRVKDRLTRAGRWSERTNYMGQGLTGKVLGIVGAGGTGKEIIRLARGFDMVTIAADPYVDAPTLAALDTERVSLEELMRRADFVVISCLLNEETYHLINARLIALMRPTAYLINVARGPIVDEQALIAALREGRIAGAGLDVFEKEPVDPDNPLLAMENTIVSPHALCWTEECFGAIASSALSDIVAALAGKRPRFVVNPEVLTHPRVQAWLDS